MSMTPRNPARASLIIAGMILLAATICLSPAGEPPINRQPAARKYLVNPRMLDERLRTRLKGDNAAALVIELSEEYTAEDYRKAADFAAGLRLPLFGWIEVARQPGLAKEHPEWVAGLGHHDDWRKRFPDFPKAGPDEVIKAWPWTTIWFEEAYQAHLARIKTLVERAPRELAGLYLNDIQGAPSSCGCGNDQCRWAQDYHVASSATKRADPETPSKFIADVQKLFPEKPVIPIWCIECEEIDQDYSQQTTGYCGTVGCFKGLCWQEYFKQLAPVLKQTDNRLAVAAFSREFRRERVNYGDKKSWVTAAVDTFRSLPPKHGAKPVAAASLDLVLQGWDDNPAQLEAETRAAESAGCRSVIIALTKIDQSWRPMVHVVSSK